MVKRIPIINDHAGVVGPLNPQHLGNANEGADSDIQSAGHGNMA